MDFMNADKDRVISFRSDPQGLTSFDVLVRFEPLEFEGLQPVYWRKVHRSEPYPSKSEAFAAACGLFSWIQPAWRAELEA